MKNVLILRLVAVVFVIITTLLLVLTIANVINSTETKELVIKLAAVCGIIAAASMVLTFLGKSE